MQSGAPRLVLASGSAARRALLTAAGLTFDVVPATVEEGVIKAAMRAEGESADDTALALAEAKAASVTDPDAVVIGADQLLVCDGEWFDKPADLLAARAHLVRLRGRRHELVTAATCWRGGAVLACVGAYRLEGLGVHLFEAVDGEHAAILGLPLLPLLACLRDHAVTLG